MASSISSTDPENPGRRRFLTVVGTGFIGALCAACASPLTQVTTTVAAPPSTSPRPTPPPTSSTTAAPAPSTTVPATTTTTPDEPPVAPAASLAVLCRKAWGAHPPTSDYISHQIQRITLHHTGSFLESVRHAPAAIRGHQTFHQGERGWSDLAYHFIVDPAGNVYEGRPVSAAGDTATTYDPTGHLLVCLEGNYDQQQTTPDQIDAVVGLCAWACQRYDVAPDSITGHGDWTATACPGGDVRRLLSNGTITARVADLLMRGGTEVTTICGRRAAARLVSIEDGTG